MKRRAKTMLTVSVAVDYPGFYSIAVEGRVAGSALPSRNALLEQMQMLLKNDNVRGMISLTRSGVVADQVEDAGVEYLHLPTTDKCPLSLEDLVKGAAFIDGVYERTGGVVLVHCREGIGRTGTMIAGWLMLSTGMSARDAVAEVRSKRVGSIHQRHQEMRLYQLERVMADPAAMRQLREGTYDEQHFDFGVLKAATAELFARLHDQFIRQMYYFRWLSRATADGDTSPLSASSPKFMSEQRSPQWKPKLNLALYLEKEAAAKESEHTADADAAEDPNMDVCTASPRANRTAFRRHQSLPPPMSPRAAPTASPRCVPSDASRSGDDEVSSSAGLTMDGSMCACSPRAAGARRRQTSGDEPPALHSWETPGDAALCLSEECQGVM